MKKSLLCCFMVSIFLFGGCSPAPVLETSEITTTVVEQPTPDSTQVAADRYPDSGVIYQWGIGAEASTEFANPEWGAEQAAGEPNAPGCGDYQFAWASAASDSIDTLEIAYSRSVYPLEIVVHQSFNPDQVIKVEVFDSISGGYYTVLQKNPVQIDRPCPYQLIIPVEGLIFKTNLVRITVDQSQLGLGWNEIDAVQLIGSINQP